MISLLDGAVRAVALWVWTIAIVAAALVLTSAIYLVKRARDAAGIR
jgi:hypothetical protein